MQITITLTDKELKFLQGMIEEDGKLEGKIASLEDVIHECIGMAMYDESEKGATEEGM